MILSLRKGQNTPQKPQLSPLKSLQIVCKPLVQMFFPVLGAHNRVTKIRYQDRFLKKILCKMAIHVSKTEAQHVKSAFTTRR